jgi:hypothetical protein
MATMSNITTDHVPELPDADFDNLSDDVKNYITKPKQYDTIYSEIKEILNNEKSMRLDNTDLLQYFISNFILQDESLINYLRNNDNIFNMIYTSHYIRNQIDFVLMNKLESMCQCWLMYLYH